MADHNHRSTQIKPDRVLDDLGREAVAAVADRSHADILSDTPPAPAAVSVTMPRVLLLGGLALWIGLCTFGSQYTRNWAAYACHG